jgi:RNA polymerase sigma factor (sigma-70 family)
MNFMNLPLNHDPDHSSADLIRRFLLDSSTNLDLLAAIKSKSTDSWPLFEQKYSRILRNWCDQWNATPEDSDDVVQETLLELFQKINDYKVQPDVPFRAWLRKVAYYRYLRLLKKNRRITSFTDAKSTRQSPNSAKIVPDAIRDAFLDVVDQIAEKEIVEIAFVRIANRIDKENWLIFCRKELEGVPAKTIAEEFNVSINAVDITTFRVRKMIRVELESLDPPERTTALREVLDG